MIGALSSSLPVGLGNPDAALGAVDSQIASYEVKLADWVNCPSCKTPEGKAKIADIRSKIAGLKQQKQAIEQRRPTRQKLDAATVGATPATSLQNQAIAPLRPVGPLGHRLDVLA